MATKLNTSTDIELLTPSTQYAMSDQGHGASNPDMVKYNMYYTASMCNVRLNQGDASSPTIYYMQSKTATTDPRLLLRRGPDKKAPVVSFCKMHYTSSDMMIGLGNCEDKSGLENTTFEELVRERNMLRSSDYRFSTEDSAKGERVEFVWKKDRKYVATSIYTCEDPQGRCVARMLSGGAWNWKKGGEVDVAEGAVGLGTKELLIVSAMAIWVWEGLSGRSYFKGYDKSVQKGKSA